MSSVKEQSVFLVFVLCMEGLGLGWLGGRCAPEEHAPAACVHSAPRHADSGKATRAHTRSKLGDWRVVMFLNARGLDVP